MTVGEGGGVKKKNFRRCRSSIQFVVVPNSPEGINFLIARYLTAKLITRFSATIEPMEKPTMGNQ